MNEAARKRLIGVALIATMGATVWVSDSEDSEGGVGSSTDARDRARSTRQASADVTAEAGLDLERLRPRADKVDAKALFPPQTWAPPPPPARPPSAAERAAARRPPPMPFKYFGGMVEDGRPIAFLSRGNRDYSVKVGDTIDRQYRIEEITEKSIVMTYIPLDERQTLATGGGR